MKPHKKLLLVEDNPDYAEAATNIFQQQGYEVTHRKDYHEGINSFNGIDAVVTDLMMPEETGTGKRARGYKVIENAAKEKSSLAMHLETKDQEYNTLEDITGTLEALTQAHPEINYDQTIASMKRCSKYLGENQAVQIGKKALQNFRQDFQHIYEEAGHIKENYEQSKKALAESEHNQGLGLLIAEEAEKRGLPVVIATDAWHHNQLVSNYFALNISTPIVEGFADTHSREERPEGHKTHPAYWQRVQQTLEQRMS